jgi:hypothetical protein
MTSIVVRCPGTERHDAHGMEDVVHVSTFFFPGDIYAFIYRGSGQTV